MTITIDNTVNQCDVEINFDSEWKFQQATILSAIRDWTKCTYDDDHWTSVDLPHYVPAENTATFWYRKDFTLKSKFDSQQRILLVFDDNNDQHSTLSVCAWLNDKPIYTGFLPNSFELTQYVRFDSINILAISSRKGRSLSLRSRIVIPGVCSGHINFDETDEDTTEFHNQKLDYSASFNDSDGLIHLFIDSIQPYEKRIQTSNESENSEESMSSTISHRSGSDSKIFETPIPRLAILMLIVGTRGDVQPFIALAKTLRHYGHRVRLATHETFRKFVRENGIEFFPLAGDPADLMSFMVKNAGIFPSMSSIVAGDITKNRRIMSEILASTWRACIEPDDETGVPFIAEAIIANPPSYGHIHCAQKLQIPLHMMFTMPWSPTGVFPHPLCKVNYDLGSMEKINSLSYDAIEMLTWSGMSDLINEFRKEKLGLPSLHTRQAIRLMIDERVPFTYCWSPTLVPKPKDWGSHINISGFFFLDLATNYTPPEDLMNFIQAGKPPIYIGFGSITGHDQRRILKAILKALKITEYRAIISNLANEEDILPNNVFRISNCPHDWLFQHVSSVCHHGGAGTTAAGLRAGKPTIIVPFFGDQFFWGSMIYKSGAGPAPIPGKRLNSNDLIEAFHFVHEESARIAAIKLSEAFRGENGCDAAARAFHKHLPLTRLRSDFESTFAACLQIEQYNIHISRPVAQVLLSAGVITGSDLSIYPTRDWGSLMYDGRPHVPTHGFIKHGKKALTCLFVDTANGLKRAASASSLTTGTLDGAESIVRGVGKSIGHFYIGCLSFYGELTDALEQLPKLYDIYADSDYRQRPHVAGFTSGAKAAERSIIYGFKDGLAGIVNKPRAGYQRHGAFGGAAGAAVAIPNMVVKPVVGTLASITWLGRGIYAEAKNYTHRKNSNPELPVSILAGAKQSNESAGDLFTVDEQCPVIRASFESGFHLEICKRILDQFEQTKLNYDESRSSSSTSEQDPLKPTKKSVFRLNKIFRRQRSRSVAGQNGL